MKTLQLVIELGSSNTVIYRMGNGIVLREPSLVALKNGEIIEVGLKAKKMNGKTDDNISIISPIKQGVIVNEKLCSQMLSKFLDKVFDFMVPKQFEVLFCVQNGLSQAELIDFKNVAYSCNAKSVDFINVTKASALSLGYNNQNPHATIVVNIGGGTTNLAVVSLGEVIDGFSLGFGGLDMDKSIKEYVDTVYGHSIGLNSAEKLKNQCGSLYVQDRTNLEVSGIDIMTKKPQICIVGANDILNSVEHFFNNIVLGVEQLLHICTPDIVAEITENGILVCGGVANITGLEDYMSKKLNLKVVIPEQPENSAILGGALFLSQNR